MHVKSIAVFSKGSIILTFIKLPSVNKIFVFLCLSGCLRQVLLYIVCESGINYLICE